jgi:hypothetical protein
MGDAAGLPADGVAHREDRPSCPLGERPPQSSGRVERDHDGHGADHDEIPDAALRKVLVEQDVRECPDDRPLDSTVPMPPMTTMKTIRAEYCTPKIWVGEAMPRLGRPVEGSEVAGPLGTARAYGVAEAAARQAKLSDCPH